MVEEVTETSESEETLEPLRKRLRGWMKYRWRFGLDGGRYEDLDREAKAFVVGCLQRMSRRWL